MRLLRSLVLTVCALAACSAFGAVAVATAQEPVPVTVSGSTSPGSLPYTGGSATISATVTAGAPITSVSAEVSGTDGTYRAIALTPTGSAGGYSAPFDVPANYTDQPVSYQVTVHALAADDSTGEGYAGEVNVDAAPQFDEKPAVSDVSVSPTALPAAGGTVSIAATATDNRSVNEVHATLTGPGARLRSRRDRYRSTGKALNTSAVTAARQRASKK